MRKKSLWLSLSLLGCMAAAYAGPRPQRGHGGEVPWLTLEVAEATRRTRPMLVYFGAEWCAPCKILETQVFNQPEVASAMKELVPVYIDGDRDGASQLMERFKVAVYPTLLVIDPDGKEKGRFVGSSEKAEVLAFLKTSATPDTPLTLLDATAEGSSLTPAQWQTLATLHVLDAFDAQFQGESSKAAVRAKRGKLSKALAAARANAALPTSIADILAVKLLLIDALIDKPAEAIPAHRAALTSALGKTEVVLRVRLELIDYAEAFLDYLEPEQDNGRSELAKLFVAALERLYDHPETTPAWKMAILATELPMLPLASKNVDADKTRFADRVEAELKLADTSAKRLAIAQAAARVLRRTGRELRGEAVLRETLKMSPDAYYLLGTLAGYAQLRGDLDGYLEISERAYRLSLERTNGLGSGSSWLKALIAHSPHDTDRITAAAEEVLGHAMAAGDAYLGWTDETMKFIANTLGTWMSAGDKAGAPAADRITVRFRAVCESLRNDAAQAKACDETFALLAKPEIEPAKS